MCVCVIVCVSMDEEGEKKGGENFPYVFERIVVSIN